MGKEGTSCRLGAAAQDIVVQPFAEFGEVFFEFAGEPDAETVELQEEAELKEVEFSAEGLAGGLTSILDAAR